MLSPAFTQPVCVPDLSARGLIPASSSGQSVICALVPCTSISSSSHAVEQLSACRCPARARRSPPAPAGRQRPPHSKKDRNAVYLIEGPTIPQAPASQAAPPLSYRVPSTACTLPQLPCCPAVALAASCRPVAPCPPACDIASMPQQQAPWQLAPRQGPPAGLLWGPAP